MTFPNSVLLSELRTAAQQRADMVNSDFVSDAEWTQLINLSYFELYDLLVQKYGNDYFVAAPYAFTSTPGTATVALPADFYKALGLDVSVSGGGSNSWLTVKPFNFGERNKFLVPGLSALAPYNLQYRINGSNLLFISTPSQTLNFQLWYIPRLTPLVGEDDTADGVS